MAVEAGSIGARLRAAREKLGLTVLQAAEKLHTDPRILDAMEGDDFATLGAPVYARGHIKHYAELVGESPLELNALYSNSSQAHQPDLTKIAKAPPSDGSSKLVAPALLVIAVFAVAGAIWWVSALSSKKPRLSETHVVEPLVAESPAGPGAQGDTAGAGSGTATGPAADEAKSGSLAAAPPARGSSANGPAMQGRVGGSGSSGTAAQSRAGAPGARAASGAAASAGAATASGTAGPPSTSSNGAVASNTGTPRSKPDATVTLRYSADSWTEVYDASGTRLFYDVGSANSVQSFTGAYPLRVVLGNAAGVSVEFNGRNESIASLLHPDGSAQFSINRSGRVLRARPVADGG